MRPEWLPLAALTLCAGMLGVPAAAATPAEVATSAPLLEEFRISGKAPPTIEDFTARPAVDSVVLSPGGTRLVIGHMARSTMLSTRTPHGTRVTLPTLDGSSPQLSFLDFPSMESVRSRQFQYLIGFTDIRWASEHRLLIPADFPAQGFSLLRNPVGTLTIGDVQRSLFIPMNMDPQGMFRNTAPVELRRWGGGETVTKAEGPLRIVEARTDKPDRVLIQTTKSEKNGNRNKYGAFEMDATNGALTRVASLPADGGRFITGAERRVALVTALNARDERVIYYLPPGMRERDRVNPQVGNWQLRVTSSGAIGLEPVVWTGRGEEYYALDGRDLPTQAVVIWDAEHDTRDVLYSHPDVDINTVALDPSGKPWVFSGSDHYPLYWYPDPEHPLARLHRALVQRLPREQIEILSSTDDYAYAVVKVSGASRPPVFLVLDVRSVRLLRTFYVYPQLNGVRLAPVDAIEFRARDGLHIRGYLTTPLDSDGNLRRKAPLIVISHSRPAGTPKDSGYDLERQLFAAHGYAVLEVNHRGLRGRGEEFADSAKWHKQAQDDIVDGVRWATNDGVADAERICVFGSGYGARLTLAAAARETGLFKCAIGVNGSYDALLIGNAGSIQSKVLLMHQQHDPDFPVEPASRLRDALQSAGNAPQWETIRADSGVLTPSARASIYRQIFNFLGSQLER